MGRSDDYEFYGQNNSRGSGYAPMSYDEARRIHDKPSYMDPAPENGSVDTYVQEYHKQRRTGSLRRRYDARNYQNKDNPKARKIGAALMILGVLIVAFLTVFLKLASEGKWMFSSDELIYAEVSQIHSKDYLDRTLVTVAYSDGSKFYTADIQTFADVSIGDRIEVLVSEDDPTEIAAADVVRQKLRENTDLLFDGGILIFSVGCVMLLYSFAGIRSQLEQAQLKKHEVFH